jgi:hypothetical protein
MPAPPRPDPPAGSIRASLNGINGPNSRWTNVFWIRDGSQSVPSDAALNSIAQIVYGSFKDKFLIHMNTEAVLEGCQVIYYGANGLAIGGQYILNSNGTRVGTPLPAQVASVVSWHLQQRYRGGHPRTYIGALVDDIMRDQRLFLDSWCDTLRVSADEFHFQINAMNVGGGADSHLGTVSFVLDKAWRSPPVFRDFTPGAAIVDNRIDTMRRRLGHDV